MQANRFSIKEVEVLTGVKQHTIRIWEQRYKMPQPKRTATNIRYYTDNDLKLLLNIAMLNRIGHKISKIACLNECEIEQLVLQHIEKSSSSLLQLESLLNAMMRMDEVAFDNILEKNISRIGVQQTFSQLVFPFLHRVGMMWQAGCVCPAFEHFLTNLVRQKIITATDKLKKETTPDAKKFLLFLPQGESHELGLLYANYLLHAHGHKSIYLGQNLPFDCLQTAFNAFHPDYIVSVITSPVKHKDVQDFIKRLANGYPKTKIILSGEQLLNKSVHLPQNIMVMEDFDRFTHLLETIRK